MQHVFRLAVIYSKNTQGQKYSRYNLLRVALLIYPLSNSDKLVFLPRNCANTSPRSYRAAPAKRSVLRVSARFKFESSTCRLSCRWFISTFDTAVGNAPKFRAMKP